MYHQLLFVTFHNQRKQTCQQNYETFWFFWKSLAKRSKKQLPSLPLLNRTRKTKREMKILIHFLLDLTEMQFHNSAVEHLFCASILLPIIRVDEGKYSIFDCHCLLLPILMTNINSSENSPRVSGVCLSSPAPAPAPIPWSVRRFSSDPI